MINGQTFKNLDNETLTICSITNDSYPTNKINGAYVKITTRYGRELEQHMSIESIYNFIEN